MRPRLATLVAVVALAPVVLAAQARFHSAVDVVELNVAVRSGRSVAADLVAADFHVTDNGTPQPILSVTREVLPIDVTLLLDTSESLRPQMLRSLVSAANRVRGRLRRTDRVSLVTFNERIQERTALALAADVKTFSLGTPAGQTSLNDALAVVLAPRPVTDRRQMAIVFTDGVDSASFLSEAAVLNLAGRSNTAIFFISVASTGLAPIGEQRAPPGAEAKPLSFFERVAAATGGVAQSVAPYRVVTDIESKTRIATNNNLLDDSFLKALEDFRTSYVLRYQLTVPRAGWHAVVVTVVKPGKTYQVRTRTGYIG
jgi:VWFA-related protein